MSIILKVSSSFIRVHCHNLFEEQVSVAKTIENTKCESQEYQTLNKTFTNLKKLTLLTRCKVNTFSLELIALITNVKCKGTKKTETAEKTTLRTTFKRTKSEMEDRGKTIMPSPTDKDFIVNAEFMKTFMSLDENTRHRIGHR